MRALGWLKSVGLITAASISALPFIFSSKGCPVSIFSQPPSNDGQSQQRRH
jgi:hypothetical protein